MGHTIVISFHDFLTGFDCPRKYLDVRKIKRVVKLGYVVPRDSNSVVYTCYLVK
jgi:hypothetical protein